MNCAPDSRIGGGCPARAGRRIELADEEAMIASRDGGSHTEKLPYDQQGNS